MTRAAQVLIVEDRKVARLTLREILVEFECVVSEAEDGATALDLIAAKQFDVIFLDLMLPDMSGIEILRRARSIRRPLGKVIILTGLPEAKTEVEAEGLGAFRYLKKNPIDWAEITSAFTEAISDVQSIAAIPPKPLIETPSATSRELKIDTRQGATPKSARRGRKHLLVVDNEQAWLDTISQVLEPEFELTLTTSHEEAYRRLKKERFALVVLDMILGGGVNGLDVLSKMRKAAPNLRAIILTGQPDYKSALEGGRRGALDYVSKGDLKTLHEAVTRVLADHAMPIRVFLSYEKTDRIRVSHIFEKLTGEGFLPWMDVKSILAGEWEPAIRRAIAQSDYFVFFLSNNSVGKEGVIRREVRQALDRQDGMREGSVYFLIARLDDCEGGQPFSRFQYTDLFKRDGFTRLVQTLSSDRSRGE